MADCNNIPAPAQIPFEADEILIYGVPNPPAASGVISVTVTAGGTGYTGTLTVVFTPTTASDRVRSATATATVSSGGVTAIQMVRSGAGYTSAPSVTFAGGGGTGATATAVLGLPLPTAILNLDGNWDIVIQGLFTGDKPQAPPFQIVIAYGYAYEGHCYRFDRPRILAFQGQAGSTPAVGCGYDNLNYTLWRIKSNKRIIELSALVDDASKTVLEANMPGMRPPNTYSAHMQLAHRGGRLTNT